MDEKNQVPQPQNNTPNQNPPQPPNDNTPTPQTPPQQETQPQEEMPLGEPTETTNEMTDDVMDSNQETLQNEIDESMNDFEAEEDPLAPPNGSSNKVKLLLGLTAVLIVSLIGAVYWFFLRPEDTPDVAVTPSPTPGEVADDTSEDTHLECRYGLCVEVPGAGENICSSSFDCEQVTGAPTGEATPTTSTEEPTATPAETTDPTATPTAAPTTVAVKPTTMPTNTPMPTSAPTLATTPTVTPTPLAAQLPESGTGDMTLLFAFGALGTLTGGFLLRRKESI